MMHRHQERFIIIPSNYRKPVPSILIEKINGTLAMLLARKIVSMKNLYQEKQQHFIKSFIKTSYGDIKSRCVV